MLQSRTIVSLNSGSSSLKFAVYRLGFGTEERLIAGAVEQIGLPSGRFWVSGKTGAMQVDEIRKFSTSREAFETLLTLLQQSGLPTADAFGHRVVHGGPEHVEPELVTRELLDSLKACVPLARLHLPSQLAGIEFLHHARPSIPQVACFDTTFHHRIPEVAQRLPLRRDLWNQGLRKYGFHGLSYDYVVNCLGDAAKGAVIIAHLGNGASMAAVRDGHPVDTSMSFTPTGGIMMGTRSGDLDPGILLYLLKEKGYDSARLTRLVEEEAGLLGVSETTSDMKQLLKQAASDPRAAQAIEMFCYSAKKQIGALASALGGLNILVFTGGIGEKAPEIRMGICRGLAFLGIELHPTKNRANEKTISTPESRCTVQVIPTDEDLMVARYTYRVAFGTS